MILVVLAYFQELELLYNTLVLQFYKGLYVTSEYTFYDFFASRVRYVFPILTNILRECRPLEFVRVNSSYISKYIQSIFKKRFSCWLSY